MLHCLRSFRKRKPGAPSTKWMEVILLSYSVLLVLLAVLPINSNDATINHTYVVSVRLDYLLHFGIFFIWMLIFVSVVINKGGRNLQHKIGYLTLGLLFVVANEFVQYLIPYRAFNVNDLIANVLGSILGSVLILK